MPNLFELGGGAGIGSYIVVFRDGRLAEETKLLKLRGAYESGEQIYFSVMDEQTKDALVPASGWIDEEGYLHLVARDFDDNKTYSVVLGDAPAESEIEVEYAVEDGIEAGGEPLGGAVSVSGNRLVIPAGEPEEPDQPLVVIDGIGYYHKYEFDLEGLAQDIQEPRYLNPLNGEDIIFDEMSPDNIPYLAVVYKGEALIDFLPNNIADSGRIYPAAQADYVSHAFNVVDNPEDVESANDIWIFGYCSAYYGYYDAANNKFISYFNLKEEPEFSGYIDAVEQGNAVMPLKDSRLPDASSEDAGMALVVGPDGNYELGEGGGSDARIPTPEAADAGKILKVDENGDYALDDMKIAAADIDSTGARNKQILTADGQGHTSFAWPSAEGTANFGRDNWNVRSETVDILEDISPRDEDDSLLRITPLFHKYLFLHDPETAGGNDLIGLHFVGPADPLYQREIEIDPVNMVFFKINNEDYSMFFQKQLRMDLMYKNNNYGQPGSENRSTYYQYSFVPVLDTFSMQLSNPYQHYALEAIVAERFSSTSPQAQLSVKQIVDITDLFDNPSKYEISSIIEPLLPENDPWDSHET